MKGNGDDIEGMTLESVLEANMYMFKRPSAGFAFSREATCTRDIERGGPPMANNHCKKRKKSVNEIMIESHRKKPCCSLCFGQKHNANTCRVLERHQAWMVQPKYVDEWPQDWAIPCTTR